MATIITENFRIENAKKFSSSFRPDSDNTYYVMAAATTPNARSIANTQKSQREFQRRVIFGNKIETRNVKYIFNNETWEFGVVYDSFDDEKNIESTNMIVTVINGDHGETPYNVFKCIRNNNRAVSTIMPSKSNLDVNNETTLSDGYVWKYMFDVPPSEYLETGLIGGLSYVENAFVVENAEENISDIIIENAVPNQFSNYIISSFNNETGVIEPSIIESIENLANNRYRLIIRVSANARNENNIYNGMYFRLINPGQVGAIYDIIGSEVATGNIPNRLSVFIESAVELPRSLVSTQCDIVPKINVSKTTGRQCIAFGEIDANGTLVYVHFADKGSSYKYATAKLSLPENLIGENNETTQLRVVVSPKNGHGSNPVSEMNMSRIATITNFFSSPLTNTPSRNYYTSVGLVKNPQFYDDQEQNTLSTFDNRIEVALDGDFTSIIEENNFLTQFNADNDETLTSLIHEISYDSIANSTILQLVDYDGDFISVFQAGNAEVKSSLDTTDFELVTISSVSDRKYVPFSGKLLHFIDFDPVERLPSRKERIKFIFDF